MGAIDKAKICLLVDVRGWAFENIALRIKDKLKQQCEVDILYIGDYQQNPSALYLRLFNNGRPYKLVHFFWRGSLGKLYGSHSVADAAATLTKAGAEQFLHNIAAAIKTTWICDHLFLDNSIESIWLRRTLGYVDHYAVSSQILGSIYGKLEGCPAPDMVISDGVDLAMFNAEPRRKTLGDAGVIKIGWAGNSTWGPEGIDHKGLVSVIKPAIELLKEEGHPISGHFCDRQKQWTAREDMPDYYRSIDIYVCASLSEGTPNPILEAMACGLPILSTDVGIVSEAFGPLQQEFIVADRRSGDFLEKLRKLIENPGLREQLSAENIDAIRRWDWRERITEWEHFLMDAIAVEREPECAEKQLATLHQSISLSGLDQQIAPPTRDHNAVRPTGVCLAMLVCDEAAIIGRCLDSVIPYVDRYFILDTGSTDNTVSIIKQSIGHLPGKLEHTEFTSFDDLRRKLFKGASIDADFVLFVDADETLHCVSSSLGDLGGLDVGRIEIATPTHSLIQPRLIRAATQLSCVGAYSESVVFPSEVKQHYLQTVRIQHHCDGNRHAKRQSLEDEKQYLLDQLELTAAAGIHLNLARVYLRMNDIDHARDMLVNSCRNPDSGEAGWQAHYLLGLLLETSRGDLAEAENHYRLAFELAPDRVEALFRLIKMRIDNEQLQAAQSLAGIAAEIAIPVHTDYFERRLYEQEVPACLRELANKLPAQQVLKSAANEASVEFVEGSAGSSKDKPPRLIESALESDQQSGVAPKLTVGMATYDDYDGVYFSAMAISLYHSEVLDQIELIVIDNNPGGKCTNALSALCKTLPFARYIAVSGMRGTAVRDSIFAYARGAAVACIDSHVMLFPNALKKLIDYFDEYPDSIDLYQGPLIRDDKSNAAYCMSASWNKGMLGVWESDQKMLDPDLPPFEIQMQGLGLFACRKAAWPSFNPRFSGFGGEEGYIHEKFRQCGGKVICLPFLQWVHRFERPMGPRYSNVWEDRIRNYLIGHDELGQDTQALESHFTDHLGFMAMAKARQEFVAERARATYQFDAVYCINHNSDSGFEQTLAQQMELLGVTHRVQNVKIIRETKSALSNRLSTQIKIVQGALLYGFQRILIFDQRSLFHRRVDNILLQALSELLSQDWDICYFDLGKKHANTAVVSDTQHLVRVDQPTGWRGSNSCGNVIAINHTGYADFIANTPTTDTPIKNTARNATYAVTPKIATQIDYLEHEEYPIWYIDPEDT